jgi:AraC family transcriptional activator FtrA
MFELAIPCEVFEPGRQDFPVPWWYELQLCAVQDGPVRTAEGLLFDSSLGLDELSTADTVIIPGCADRQNEAPEALLQALRTAYDRGARIASICTGAFILAAAGLLDGRTVTTHWMHAAELTRRWPAVRVEPNVLYTDDSQILTSAGSAAGLDLCLHIVCDDHGTRIANTLARRLAGVGQGAPRHAADRPGPRPPGHDEPSHLRSAHQMRTHFTRINHVTPHAYQRTFRSRAAA